MVQVWTMFTDLDPERQGVCFSRLKVKHAALELHEDEINSKDGVKIIIAMLDKLYKKGDALYKFQALMVL